MKVWAREVGGYGAGGGQRAGDVRRRDARAIPGMELSLFSRDTIALSTAIALSHGMFEGTAIAGHLRQDRAGAVDRRD